jgi:hypothetical protein
VGVAQGQRTHSSLLHEPTHSGRIHEKHYSAEEIDAIAAYAPDTDGCYLIPISEVAGCKAIRLRVAPTRNNQALGVHWARDYELLASLRRNWGINVQHPPAVEEPAPRAIG